MHRILLVLVILAAAVRAATVDERIQQAFAPHLETHDIAGAAIAVAHAGEITTVYLGKSNLDTGSPPDGQTLFEIGSITKVMTGTLLALAIQDGAVALDTPVQDLLPANHHLPTYKRQEITLEDIATHTSGLPRMPGNWHPADRMQPYADYHAEQLYTFLDQYELPRPSGKKYEYSNMAVALLGQVLALKATTPYENLLRTRILSPLGMADTHLTAATAPMERAATGYTAVGKGKDGKTLEPRAMWDFDAFQPAGAVRSNIADMAKFLTACMTPPDSPLGAAIRLAQQPRFKVNDQLSVGLNWHILSRPGQAPITWHNGQTGGFHAFLGFDPVQKTGIVVLCNADFDIDAAAIQLLAALAAE